MKTKICSKCKIEQSLNNFHKGNDKDNLDYRCKNCMKKINRIYRLNHKEQHKNYWLIYIKNHKKEIKERRKKYQKNRLKKDVNFKLRCYLSTRLYQVTRGISKSKSTIKLLGCSIDKLKKHLEKKFTKGMNWDNYGRKGWVIDHIKPCASFDLKKKSEQIKCFNYKNLQPLWEKDNWEKNNKF